MWGVVSSRLLADDWLWGRGVQWQALTGFIMRGALMRCRCGTNSWQPGWSNPHSTPAALLSPLLTPQPSTPFSPLSSLWDANPRLCLLGQWAPDSVVFKCYTARCFHSHTINTCTIQSQTSTCVYTSKTHSHIQTSIYICKWLKTPVYMQCFSNPDLGRMPCPTTNPESHLV